MLENYYTYVYRKYVKTVVVEQFNTSIWGIRVGEVRSVMSSLSISITSIITSAGATNAKIVPFSTDIQQLQKRSNQQKCYSVMLQA